MFPGLEQPFKIGKPNGYLHATVMSVEDLRPMNLKVYLELTGQSDAVSAYQTTHLPKRRKTPL